MRFDEIYQDPLMNEVSFPKKEILSRIEQTRRSLASVKKLFINGNHKLQLHIRMLRYYIFPLLLYGAESWTFTQLVENRIDTFEMYLYQRTQLISWTDRITKVKVPRRIDKDKELLTTLKERNFNTLDTL